ncbi:MAG: hypothetical protein ABRQ23_01795 [Syntrophomonadaceae bacterium]
MHYKRFFLTTTAFILLLLIGAGGINYAVDPLQYFHRAWFYPPVFSVEQRYQNPGLARNYGGDTVIIGSSMTENFVPSQVDQILGVKSVKLSMSAATAREEAMMIDLALRRGQVKTVIWGLDFASLKGAPNRVSDEDVPFPYYLYDRQPVNDLAYLFSITALENSLQILKNYYQHIPTPSPELEYLNNWSDKYWFDHRPIMQRWQEEQSARNSGTKLYQGVDGSLPAMRRSFDINILPLVKANPEVEFLIYYPPYSILRYRSMWEEDPDLFDAELGIKHYIFAELQQFPNVSLYDFQADPVLTFDLDNYKDYSHHSTLYNRLILEALASKDPKYLVTPSNINRLLTDLRVQVETLDVESMYKGTPGS